MFTFRPRVAKGSVTGWFSGAIDQILAAKGSPIRTVTVQEYSGAEDGHDDGLFVTRPL